MLLWKTLDSLMLYNAVCHGLLASVQINDGTPGLQAGHSPKQAKTQCQATVCDDCHGNHSFLCLFSVQTCHFIVAGADSDAQCGPFSVNDGGLSMA